MMKPKIERHVYAMYTVFHAMSNYVRNFHVKNYSNQATTPQLIANNMSGCFFLKHGVNQIINQNSVNFQTIIAAFTAKQ